LVLSWMRLLPAQTREPGFAEADQVQGCFTGWHVSHNVRMKTATQKVQAVIGWREWVALPGLAVRRTKAKIDTGARTSSLHAFGIEPFVRGESELWVRFTVAPLQRKTTKLVSCEERVIDQRWVKNTGGKPELRFVISTIIELAGITWPVEISLARRDTMGFRMLLGREAIRGRFVVDPGRSFLVSKRLKKKHPTKKLPG